MRRNGGWKKLKRGIQIRWRGTSYQQLYKQKAKTSWFTREIKLFNTEKWQASTQFDGVNRTPDTSAVIRVMRNALKRNVRKLKETEKRLIKRRKILWWKNKWGKSSSIPDFLCKMDNNGKMILLQTCVKKFLLPMIHKN